jgi:deoxyribose-phosphate aldolase
LIDNIARCIDHTLVRPDATQAQIAQLCREARELSVAGVAVNTVHTEFASRLMRGSGIAVVSAIAFPLGAVITRVKACEAEQALADGATELDMVINIGALKGGQHDLVEQDIATVARLCHAAGALCKAILETGLLTDEEKIMACQLAESAGADYVKTCTGFGPAGATVHDVALMRRTVGDRLGVKAAGSIRTYEEAVALLEAGATRLGVSAASSLQIVREELSLQ